MNTRKIFGYCLIAVILIALAFTACPTDDGGNGGKIPAALVGEWYTSADDLAFKITSAGKLILADGQSFDISVSGKTIELKTSGTSVGTFDYAISNGEMTMTNGINVGMSLTFLSPLVKKGGSNGKEEPGKEGPGGGTIPSALVGEWYTTADDLAFEITSAGKLILTDDQSFDISVSGKTVTLKSGSTTVGTFDYAISNGEMTITNGTNVGLSLTFLSPLVKKGGGIDIGGEGPGGGNVPSALVGEWHPKANDTMPAFEITSAGKCIINSVRYDVSVSGSTVELKYEGTLVGRFNYAISNGEMTITQGTGIGIMVAAFSPVVRFPASLIGEWHTGTGDLAFEITAAGKFIFVSNSYDISLSDQLIRLKTGGTTVGTFYYYITDDTMIITGESGIGMSIASLSPVQKQEGTIPIGPGVPGTYIVIFHANGGSGTGPTAQSVNAGFGITLPDGSGLYKGNYIFDGWSTNASGTGDYYKAGDWYTPARNTTLYAQWVVGNDVVGPGNPTGGLVFEYETRTWTTNDGYTETVNGYFVTAYTAYAGYGGDVLIPDYYNSPDGSYPPVVGIADYVFSNCTNITSITLPSSIMYVGEGAFSYCTSITSITIPSSIVYVGEYAFSGWDSSQAIYIPYISGSTNGWDGNWRSGCNATIVDYSGSWW